MYNLINTTVKLILRYYWPFKSDPPSQQTAALLTLLPQYSDNPSRRCLHFEVVGGLEWSNDPESYAGSSIATGRASLAGKIKGDDSD